MSVSVIVKHGKKKYKDLEIQKDSNLEEFQALIFSLTGVPPERQTLIVKGKKIESNQDLSEIKTKSVISLVGSSQEKANVNTSNISFVEDMTQAEKQAANAVLPPGLENLGNTCYLNSTLQCIKGIDELKLELIDKASENANNTLVESLGNLFKTMDYSSDSIVPQDFVAYFRNRFPQFATRDEKTGAWQQQDADECLTQLLSTIKNELLHLNSNQSQTTVIDTLFTGQYQIKLKCTESSEEPEVTTMEDFVKLQCFIKTETRHLHGGLLEAMSEDVEKRSEILQKNAIFRKTKEICKLPPYLTVQMVRFFWKQKIQKNSKILRKVIFPDRLDVADFCNENLKQEIQKYRKWKMEKENEKLENTNAPSKNDKEEMKEKEKENNNDKMDIDNENNDSNNNNDNNNDNDMLLKFQESGYYELMGLIAHKGLSSNSGHYIGYWKHNKRGWLQFDDDLTTPVTVEQIHKLYGGGQWQMGYICFYRKISCVDDMTGAAGEKNKKK